MSAALVAQYSAALSTSIAARPTYVSPCAGPSAARSLRRCHSSRPTMSSVRLMLSARLRLKYGIANWMDVHGLLPGSAVWYSVRTEKTGAASAVRWRAGDRIRTCGCDVAQHGQHDDVLLVVPD